MQECQPNSCFRGWTHGAASMAQHHLVHHTAKSNENTKPDRCGNRDCHCNNHADYNSECPHTVILRSCCSLYVLTNDSPIQPAPSVPAALTPGRRSLFRL